MKALEITSGWQCSPPSPRPGALRPLWKKQRLLVAQPSEEITRESHCVTKWSKLRTTWERVSVDTLLDSVKTVNGDVTACCDGGYTNNLPLLGIKRALRYTTLSEVLHHLYITQSAILRNGVQAGEEDPA